MSNSDTSLDLVPRAGRLAAGSGDGWTARDARKQALQLAGDYIMDVIYPYACEEDVIIWEDSWIDWPQGLCMICVNTQYEELYEYV